MSVERKRSIGLVRTYRAPVAMPRARWATVTRTETTSCTVFCGCFGPSPSLRRRRKGRPRQRILVFRRTARSAQKSDVRYPHRIDLDAANQKSRRTCKPTLWAAVTCDLPDHHNGKTPSAKISGTQPRVNCESFPTGRKDRQRCAENITVRTEPHVARNRLFRTVRCPCQQGSKLRSSALMNGVTPMPLSVAYLSVISVPLRSG